MDFTNASLLSFQKTNEFLNSNFRFGSRVSYEIEGNFLDLQNDIGVSGLFDASELFRTGLQDYQPIILNGIDFGKGRVRSFSTNNTNSLKYSTYNVSIDGFQSGNLSNLSGKYYSGLSSLVTGNTILEAPHLLEEFSEDFSIDRNGDSFSYTHNLNIKYASGDGVIITPIQRAKGLATQIFQNVEPPFELLDSFSGQNFFTGALDEKFSESYDLINNSVTLSRKFFVNPFDYENYSVKHSQNFTKSENGEVTVSEQGSIKVKSLAVEVDLSEALKSELESSYDRCNEIYQSYVPGETLPLAAASTSKSIDNFLGEATYTINFTDSDYINNDNYTLNLTNSINRSSNIIEISEKGDIIGRGDYDIEKMQKSIDGYNLEKLNIFNRCNSFYQDRGGVKTLKLERVSFSKKSENGSIAYDYLFSDDSSLVDGRRIDISVSDQDSINKYNSFSSLGEKEFVQKINTTTQGSRNLRVSINGKESDTLDTLLSEAKIVANKHIETFNDTYIEDASYNFDLEEKILQLTVRYNFNKLVSNQELL